MGNIQIRRAERKKAKLRVGMSGPSGSGKTYSSLLVARGLATDWEKVLLIDTENGSGELYSDLGPYNVITLTAPFAPESYTAAIRAAEEAGMEVIVIDSTSHEWDGKGGCLEINELIAKTKFKGNTWSAWSETTPRHQRFIEAITTSPCHIVTTARSKTDTIQTEDKKIKKVGLKEIQREGFEYELTVNFTIDREGHYALASKDRTGLFIERDPFVISQKTGEELLRWNEQGKEAPEVDKNFAKKRKVFIQLKTLGENVATAESVGEAVLRRTKLALVSENYDDIIDRLGVLIEEEKEAKKNGQQPPAPAEEQTINVDDEADNEPENTIDEIEAQKLMGTFEDEDPNRPRTRENVDGTVDLIHPDGTKQRIKGKVATNNAEKAE